MGTRSKIQVLYRDDEFVCLCAYEDRAYPKNARFWWDGYRKLWVTKSAKCAARLMEYCNEAARRTIVDRLSGLPVMGVSQSYNHRIAHRYKYTT